MTYKRFFSLISAIVALSGTIMIGLGVWDLTPESILDSSRTFYDFNERIVGSQVAQKANYFSGVILVLSAVGIQIVNLFFFDNFQKQITTIKKSIGLIFIISIFALGATILIRMYLHTKFANEVIEKMSTNERARYFRFLEKKQHEA